MNAHISRSAPKRGRLMRAIDAAANENAGAGDMRVAQAGGV